MGRDNRTKLSDLVKLDDTSPRWPAASPEAVVQIDANYAYTEGVDAEALSGPTPARRPPS